MKNLVELIVKFKDLLIYIFFSVFSLYLLYSNGFYHQNSFLNTSNELMGSFYERTGSITSYLELEERNKELRVELALAQMRLAENKYSVSRDSLVSNDSTLALQYIYREAQVINKTTNYSKNHFTLNKGSKNGIELDDGVISFSKELVGRVSKVSEHYSLVTPIINAEFALQVQLEKNNVAGLLQWSGADIKYAQVNEIGKRVRVKEGDHVITGGPSEYFPRGVSVGYITEIEPNGDVLDIEIELSAELDQVLDVMVISNMLRPEQKEIEILTLEGDTP
ncbi:MAG: rod shape-determining protein MreC [Flavobacteriales bacterium]